MDAKKLAERLIALYPTMQEQLDTAMVHTYQYLNLNNFYDLGDYANKVAEYTKDPQLASIAKELNDGLDKAILARQDIHHSPIGDLPKFSISVCLCNKEDYQKKTSWDYTYKEAYEYTNWHLFTGWGDWLNTTKQGPRDQTKEYKGDMPTHSIDAIRGFVGNGVRLLMERAIPDGAQNPQFETVFATFRQHYMQHSLDTTRPYDGIPELLHELKARGCKLAVVSNKMMAATQALVRHFFPDVDVAIGEHEAEGIRKKPAPDTVFEALRQLGVAHHPSSDHSQTSDIVYIGDSDVDIETARNSGLPCISVLWGFRSRDFLLAHGATTFAEHPADILR